MKERPILFSAPMVRALLNGTKTQTRRVVKDEQKARALNAAGYSACPYGQPGDRLWVRETWQAFFDDEVPPDRPRGPRHTMGIPAQPELKSFAFYRADGDMPPHHEYGAVRWFPSIHMPRKYSRILLEIVGVRVERLQDISRGDAMAEGCPFPNIARGANPREWYAELWDQINGPGSWSANPWVWVVEFKRVTP